MHSQKILYILGFFFQIPRAKAASLLYYILDHIITLAKFYDTGRLCFSDIRVAEELRTTNPTSSSGEQVKRCKTIQGSVKHENCFYVHSKNKSQ